MYKTLHRKLKIDALTFSNYKICIHINSFPAAPTNVCLSQSWIDWSLLIVSFPIPRIVSTTIILFLLLSYLCTSPLSRVRRVLDFERYIKGHGLYMWDKNYLPFRRIWVQRVIYLSTSVFVRLDYWMFLSFFCLFFL